MARRSIPSLTSLRAFEAYARHGRMVDAAAELCVTHGAISRQIKQLEQQLGVALLAGHPGKVALTEQAARYGQELARLFDGIDAASAALREAGEAQLRILCPGSFAMRWLIPRLAEFREAHPRIDLEIVDSSGPWNPGEEGPHGAIRIEGYEGTARARSRRFMQRRYGPVLSRALWQAAGKGDAARLLALPRLFVRTIPTDWGDWAEAAGIALPAHEENIGFGRSFHMLEAALNGLGVCIADHAYVSAEIEAGRLAAPMGFARAPRGYVFLRGRQRRNGSADLFERWLAQAGAF